MKKPKVSIIIRTKNEERWISSCLRAVLDQSYKDFEIIIVDNNSNDKTVEKAKIRKMIFTRANCLKFSIPWKYQDGTKLWQIAPNIVTTINSGCLKNIGFINIIIKVNNITIGIRYTLNDNTLLTSRCFIILSF